MDDLTIHALVLLPVGLGLLGFIEPCTIGGHLVFLGTQEGRRRAQRSKALITFILARTVVTGGFGVLVTTLGQTMIGMQTTLWLVFGTVYIVIGLVSIMGYRRVLNVRINIVPETWRRTPNPLVLGLAFGVNIPACAAPILFGLLAMAATTGTALAGFLMMAVFGLALSLPLALFVYVPRLTTVLRAAGDFLRRRSWILGGIFLVLGTWSVWFGLYVDPANWAGK